MKTVLQRIVDIEHSLLPTYSDPLLCNQYAWWLIEYITGQTKAQLLTHDTVPLDTHQEQTLKESIIKLTADRMPIQYILGSVPFNDLDIIVKPPILIPRPETEEWSFDIATALQKQYPTQPLTILDLCCGSGCIALTLANALPHATIYATDISPAAVTLAQENVHHNNISNVVFLQSDLFEAIPSALRFDLIVSNPPYIAPEEWGTLDESVTAWEDRNALIADDHGLALIKKIINTAPSYIKTHADSGNNIPQLMIEIGYTQGPTVAELMKNAGFNTVIIRKDLEKKDRVVCGSIHNVDFTKN